MSVWDTRFRQANDWAGWHGFAAAWPNFHQADYGDGVVHGTHMLRGADVEWRDVPRSTYGNVDVDDIPGMFRAANDYAVAQGFAAGLPTFHQANYGNGVVYGTTLAKPGRIDFRDVPAATLGVFDRRDVPAMMRAAASYATANGYAAAFPTFHEANSGAGLVFGLILFHEGVAAWRDVPADLLAKYSDAPTKIAVVLCRPSDIPAPAGSDQRWRNIFVPNGSDVSNISKYWTEVSFGQFDGQGTQVFGWLDIGQTKATVDSFVGGAQRGALANWGRQAATAAGIALGNFDEVVFCFNINADHGAVGGNTVVLAYEEGRAFEPTFKFHEVGHGLGLGHSSSQSDGTYGDRYDIMSAMNVWTFPDALNRAAGPGPSAINLENLGWLHRSRVFRQWPSTPRSVTLAALNRPDVDGFLAARISAFAPLSPSLYIEYREPTKWDAGFPGPRILVHTRNAENGPHIFGGGWNPAGALTVDEELVVPIGIAGNAAPLVVRVEHVDAARSQAVVRLWMLPKNGVRSLRIGEIMWNPPGADWAGEYVSLRNDTPSAVSLAGCQLSDVAGHTYIFPATTAVAPGHDILIWTGPGTNDPDNLFIGRHAAIWNNTGDTATLRDPTGAVIATYSYGGET